MEFSHGTFWAAGSYNDYPEIQSFVRFFNMPNGNYKYEDKESA